MIVRGSTQKISKEKPQDDHRQALFNCLIKYIILLRKNYLDTFSISIDHDLVKFMVGLIHEILIFPNKKKTHYWQIFSSCYCTELSIKFINTIDEMSNPQEKGLGWIMVEFSEKKLDKIFQKISCNENIYSFFQERENLLIINNLHNIITVLQQLKNIEYQIESKLIDNFRNYCKNTVHYNFSEENLCFKTEPVYTDAINSIKVNHTIIRRISNKSPTPSIIEYLNKKVRSPSYSPLIKKSSMKEANASIFKKKNSHKSEVVKKFLETRKRLLGKFKENIKILKSYHDLVTKEFRTNGSISQRNSINACTSICNTERNDGTMPEIKLQYLSNENSNNLTEFDTFNKNKNHEEISSDRVIEEKGHKIKRDNMHLRKQSSTMNLMKVEDTSNNPNPISLEKSNENSDDQIQKRSLSDAYKHSPDPFNTPNFNRQAFFGIKKIVTFSEDRKDRTYTFTQNDINNNFMNNKIKMEMPKISFTIDSKNQNNTFTSTDADTNSFNFIYLGETNKIESTPKILIKKDYENNSSPPIKSVYSAGQMERYYDNNNNHHSITNDKFSYINVEENEFVLEEEINEVKNPDIEKSADSKSSRSLLIKIRNSDLLQEEMERERWFSLTYEKKENLKVRPEDSLSRCDQCHKDLKKKFYFLWIDAFQCPYSGQWYCYECMAPRKRALPWNVLENFDFTEVSVSKKADSILEERFKLPIMRISHKTKIVAQNLSLYNCLILKRQIRLMYDFICHPQLMRDILGDYLNFALRKKRFSMQNLYEIKSDRMITKLENIIKETQNHIEDCEDCFKRGVRCAFCNSETLIFRFDLRGTSVCENRKCRKVFHKLCFDRIKRCLCQKK